MDEAAIATSSFASAINGWAISGLVFPASTNSSIQKADSSDSSKTVLIFEMKSAFDLARQVAR